MVKIKAYHKPDYPLVVLTLALLLFGVVMVYDASVVYAHEVFGGKYHFLILQGIWAILGVGAAFFASQLDYHRWRSFAFPIFAFCLATLVLVLIPSFGEKIFGARRWIYLTPPSTPVVGRVGFQPTEVSKLGFVLYLASWLTGKKSKVGPNPLSFAALLGILGGLILLQPDFGTALIIGSIGVAIFFVSGAPLRYFFFGIPAFLAVALLFIFSSSYRRERVLTFLNPSASDPLSSGYHILQILIAIGSGGLTGLGLGQSRQKHEYLPAVTTDSIFAIVAEELGFFGAAFLIALFTLLFYRGLKVAKGAPDGFGKLIAAGITSWLGLQTFINLGAMTRILPLTGVPLPLVSYGGSSLVVTLLGIGILLNVSRQTVRG